MSGNVLCQSVLGEGATFILRRPAWDTTPVQSEQNRPPPTAHLKPPATGFGFKS